MGLPVPVVSMTPDPVVSITPVPVVSMTPVPVPNGRELVEVPLYHEAVVL